MTSSSKSSVDSAGLPITGAETAVSPAAALSLHRVEPPAQFVAAREAETMVWCNPNLSRQEVAGMHDGIGLLAEVALGAVRALAELHMTDALRGTELLAPLSHPAGMQVEGLVDAFIARQSDSPADSAAVIQFPSQAKAA